MPAFSASAPGKAILYGEHAVVYTRPAIAVPVMDVRARAVVQAAPRHPPGSVEILAPNIDLHTWLSDLPGSHPLAAAILSVLNTLSISRAPACQIRITSTIPVAAGLGSGAAVTVAILRSLSAFLGRPLSDEQVCNLAFEVDKLHHGTPSGIDNTVITYARPVYYRRGEAIQALSVGAPFTIIIGDTGIASPTAIAVGDVRRAWQANPGTYERLFDEMGEITRQARRALEDGELDQMGQLMSANHDLLQQMGVSSPQLDRLVTASRAAGALGAKLSGGGRGGNMIALVGAANGERIRQALVDAGAQRTILTTIG